MAESVNLIAVRRRLESPGRRPFRAHAVVGIEQESGPTLKMRDADPYYQYLTEGRQVAIPLTLGASATARLVEFYERRFVDGEEMDYDCMGLPPYLKGKENDLVRAVHFQHRYGIPEGSFVGSDGLETGRHYTLRNPRGPGVHAIVGADIPTHSISALGRSIDGGGLLAYAANAHLMEAYNTVAIAPVWCDGAPY